MKRVFRFLTQIILIVLVGLGFFKAHGLYRQNLLQKPLSSSPSFLTPRSFVVLVLQDSSLKPLLSLLTQNYPHLKIVYFYTRPVDEEKALLTLFHKNDQVSFLPLNNPNAPLLDFYEAARNCHDEDILLFLREGSFLAHEQVITKLNQVYSSSLTWMTYGSALYYPCYKQLPIESKPISKNTVFTHSYRSHDLPCLSPLTFYAGLFKMISQEDLEAGTHPLFYAIPLLEMAGKHAQFLHEILTLRPHATQRPPECLATIQKMPKYKRLRSLPFSQTKAETP